MAWRQAVTVLAAAAVVAAMLLIGDSAERDAIRHERLRVAVVQVRTYTDQLAGVAYVALALAKASGANAKVLSSPLLLQASFQAWTGVSSAINALSNAEQSPSTAALIKDAHNVKSAGLRILPLLQSPRTASRVDQLAGSVQPVIAKFDIDSAKAQKIEESNAKAAERRARISYVTSLLIGLLALALLALRLHRLRRATVLIAAERVLERRSDARLRALVENSGEVITVVDEDLTVRWQSSSVERMLGTSADKLLGTRLSDLVHPNDAIMLQNQLLGGRQNRTPACFTARFRNTDGGWRNLEVIAANRLQDPAVEGVVLSMRDVSERMALEAELRHQSFHDSLTGLANRALFEDRLAHALAGAQRTGRQIGVAFVDIDDFKTINDSLGHGSGDELLRAAAARIAESVRASDTAARFGGDEFAVLLEVIDDESEIELVSRRVLDALRSPFEVSGHELRVTASVGIAKSDAASGADELVRNADTAMHVAKETGKDVVQIFEPDMHERVLHRLELTGELRRALDKREFELDYQPLVNLTTGEIVGAEALVRWGHPVRGRLAPGAFIGLAEDTGLIVPLGAWILQTACEQAAIWRRELPSRELYMSVNVSTRQLHDPEFPQTVAAALRESGLPARRLVLEVTESLLPADGREVVAQLHELKALGVLLAVDDFGTGYSALSRLQAYPVDILKIDRSFINGIELDRGKAQLVQGIVSLGESLHLRVVAEGIEEPWQAVKLQGMGSVLGQGFLFSRPIHPDRLLEMLKEGKSLSAAELSLAAEEPHRGEERARRGRGALAPELAPAPERAA